MPRPSFEKMHLVTLRQRMGHEGVAPSHSFSHMLETVLPSIR